jgi:hypothetical protein
MAVAAALPKIHRLEEMVFPFFRQDPFAKDAAHARIGREVAARRQRSRGILVAAGLPLRAPVGRGSLRPVAEIVQQLFQNLPLPLGVGLPQSQFGVFVEHQDFGLVGIPFQAADDLFDHLPLQLFVVLLLGLLGPGDEVEVHQAHDGRIPAPLARVVPLLLERAKDQFLGLLIHENEGDRDQQQQARAEQIAALPLQTGFT